MCISRVTDPRQRRRIWISIIVACIALIISISVAVGGSGCGDCKEESCLSREGTHECDCGDTCKDKTTQGTALFFSVVFGIVCFVAIVVAVRWYFRFRQNTFLAPNSSASNQQFASPQYVQQQDVASQAYNNQQQQGLAPLPYNQQQGMTSHNQQQGSAPPQQYNQQQQMAPQASSQV